VILDDIVAKTKIRLDKVTQEERNQKKASAYEVAGSASFPFYKALSKPGISYIAEVKKASPSKGLISKDFNPVEIAMEYERIGIDAISVLTERDFFLGSPEFLQSINKTVKTPTLRKDFIVDSYQIYEAKLLGASAILLICAILDENTLYTFYKEATDLGLDVLVEAHNEKEIQKALSIDARIIGINNRDLKTFNVDLNTSRRMREFIPSSKIMVSESGYSKREDIVKATEMGVDAVLIGESFMRSPSKEDLLKILKGQNT
jgi:indole-3-glycerol phosphate synthase